MELSRRVVEGSGRGSLSRRHETDGVSFRDPRDFVDEIYEFTHKGNP
jgi:hypothetical protein